MKPSVTTKSVLPSEKNGPDAAYAGLARTRAESAANVRIALPFSCASTALLIAFSSVLPPSAPTNSVAVALATSSTLATAFARMSAMTASLAFALSAISASALPWLHPNPP